MDSRVVLQTLLQQCLVFTLAERAGPVPLGQLQQQYGGMAEAYAAGPRALATLSAGADEAYRPVSARVLRFIYGPEGRSAVLDELETARRLGVTILAEGAPEYPQSLWHTDGHPAVLYVRGNSELLLRRECVAIIGSRQATRSGLQLAGKFGRELASRGVAVASGLAMGIDAAAHSGAMDGAPGSTFAVLGTGVESITPRVNAQIGRRILDSGGAIVSEFSFGGGGRKDSFPRRNRVISGLSLGTVVVEADARSGCFHTYNFTLDQGREPMAVPGPPGARLSLGPNQMIREGAHLVRDVTDILEAVGLSALVGASASSARAALEPTAATLFGRIEREAATVDDLSRETGLPQAQILAELTELEMRGLVQRSGARYVLR